MKICIIGAGTYGSYLLRRLREIHGTAHEITVLEVGAEQTQSGEEIGIGAESPNSQAPHRGRYFGLGGTSARWGGQILFFDERDNPTGDPPWSNIVEWNLRHRDQVLTTLLGPGGAGQRLSQDRGEVKTGVWLKYGRRNLFRQIPHTALAGVHIQRDVRVTAFETNGRRLIAAQTVSADGTTNRFEADRFYLVAGAFESCRLLLAQPAGKFALSPELGRNYGDHVSAELLCVERVPPVLDGVDFLPRFYRGSLITKRLVVTTSDQRVGFVHFIFNKDVQAFTDLKNVLFGRNAGKFNFGKLLGGTVFLARFGFNLLVRRRLYAHQNRWSLQFDIEQASVNLHRGLIGETRDRFGQPNVRVEWHIDAADRAAIHEVQQQMMAKLQAAGIPFRECFNVQDEQAKVEDVYHPAGMMRLGTDDRAVLDMDFRVRGTENLFHFSTAMFPSARSINPTAAGFCLIEEHLQNYPFASA